MITEEQVLARFAREGLAAQRWENGPGAAYAMHEHPYAKVLIVEQGSIIFRVARDGRAVEPHEEKPGRLAPTSRVGPPRSGASRPPTEDCTTSRAPGRRPWPGGGIEMKPGDRLDLPARTPHRAVVGPEGVVCWEAHRG